MSILLKTVSLGLAGALTVILWSGLRRRTNRKYSRQARAVRLATATWENEGGRISPA